MYFAGIFFIMKSIFQNYLKQNAHSFFNLRAIFFDMDGVLYDSMPAHARSWQQTFEEFGFKSTTADEFYLHEGRIGVSTIALIVERELKRKPTVQEFQEMYTRKTELFYQYNTGETIPHAKEVLEAVKSKGYLPVLVTGSGQPSLLERLETKFPNTFTPQTMVTGHDVQHGKPHPEPYLMALNKAGNLQPNQAIVIENAPMGVESAVKAGIFTIAVNTGPLSDKVLKDAGAHLILPSMKALKEKLPEIIHIVNTLKQ